MKLRPAGGAVQMRPDTSLCTRSTWKERRHLKGTPDCGIKQNILIIDTHQRRNLIQINMKRFFLYYKESGKRECYDIKSK